MVLYTCLFCTFNTNKKSSIIGHLSRKYRCNPSFILLKGEKITEGLHYSSENDKKNENYEVIDDKYKCNICGKLYRHKTTFYKHSKKCIGEKPEIVKKVVNIETQNIHNDYSTNITNTQNIYNNISIQINPYGKEDLSYIDKKLLTEMINEYRKLGDEADILYKFAQLVHFNDKHPENKNIQILDVDKKEELLLKIFEGTWKIIKGKDLAERMAGEKIDQIDEHSKKLKLPLVQHILLNEYLDEYSNMRTENIERKFNRLFKEEKIKNNTKRKEKKEHIWNGYQSKYLTKKQDEPNDDKIKEI